MFIGQIGRKLKFCYMKSHILFLMRNLVGNPFLAKLMQILARFFQYFQFFHQISNFHFKKIVEIFKVLQNMSKLL